MYSRLKTAVFLLLFVSTFVSAQEISVRSSCFANGETSTVDDLLRYPTLTMTIISSLNDAELISYNCVFPQMDASRNPGGSNIIKNKTFGFNDETKNLIKKLRPGESLKIQDILVEVTNKRTRKKETIEVTPVIIQIGGSSSRECGARNAPKKVDYNGKLLTGKNKSTPVKNQKVVLQDKSEAEVQTTVTDNYGDFKFTNLNAEESYRINVTAADDTKIKDNILYAAKPDGTVIRSFNKTPKGFVYELLPQELSKLTEEAEEDTQLKLRKFSQSSQSELTVIEDIYYDFNSADISPGSVPKLDKIIEVMSQNTSLKLNITSHTDSKGEDNYNKTLSQKRAQKVMDYFILQGISKDRLVAKGVGESQILNRCKNGVDCSETEHQLNRRTEFKFTK
jgi:outer membrane protein OmpA-like peptidoglycan-associated protein